MKQVHYKKILSNVDRIFAIIFLIVAIIFSILTLSKGHYGIQLPIFIFFSSTAYLLFRDKISYNEKLPEILENRLIVPTHILFFLSISFLLWLSWSNLYYRPPLYFFIVILVASSIIINIFCLNSINCCNVAIVLIKIATLSYVIYAGIYYQFHGIYGTDPWLHNKWIQETINIGHLSNSPLFVGYYYLFPIFHLNGAVTSVVTNLSIYSSLFMSCGFLMAMSGVFAFIISRKMINSKAALFVALVVPLTSTNIEKSIELIPMSLGYIFFLLIMFFIFCPAEKRSKYRLLTIFLSVVLILTHTITAFAMLLILITFFVGTKFYYSIMKINAPYEVFSPTYIYIFTVTMITRWMQQPPGRSAFFDYRFSHLIDSLQVDSHFVLDKPLQVSNISYKVLFFDQLGYLLLLAFAIIGALIFLRFQISTRNRINLVFITGCLFTIIYSFSLLNLHNILPYRWYLFLYLPLSILAIMGLFWFSCIIKNKTGRLAIVMLVILVIIFAMTTSSLANKDSPFFFNNAVRYGYTQSEFAAIHTLSNVDAGRFVTDIYFSVMFPYILTDNEFSKMMKNNKSIFIQRNYYLMNPEWNEKYKTSLVTGDEYHILVNNVLLMTVEKKYSINRIPMIYNNGNVKTYII